MEREEEELIRSYIAVAKRKPEDSERIYTALRNRFKGVDIERMRQTMEQQEPPKQEQAPPKEEPPKQEQAPPKEDQAPPKEEPPKSGWKDGEWNGKYNLHQDVKDKAGGFFSGFRKKLPRKMPFSTKTREEELEEWQHEAEMEELKDKVHGHKIARKYNSMTLAEKKAKIDLLRAQARPRMGQNGGGMGMFNFSQPMQPNILRKTAQPRPQRRAPRNMFGARPIGQPAPNVRPMFGFGQRPQQTEGAMQIVYIQQPGKKRPTPVVMQPEQMPQMEKPSFIKPWRMNPNATFLGRPVFKSPVMRRRTQ